MQIEIRNGWVIDLKNVVDCSILLFIVDGKVVGLGEVLVGFVGDMLIDVVGCVVCLGLIDFGVCLNSIEVELVVVVVGGVILLVVLFDVDLLFDELELVDCLVYCGIEIGKVCVLFFGVLIFGFKGECLFELVGLKKVGCVVFF